MKNSCIICYNSSDVLMKVTILRKYAIKYYVCKKCKCIYTETPYWTSEAYDVSIATTDTGIMLRNIEICNNLFIIIKRYFNSRIKVLDYGG